MRSLNRCKQRFMQVLEKRQLRLSGKKTRMGSIDKGFHFLGIQYPETQALDNTNVTEAVSVFTPVISEQFLSSEGG